MTIVATSSITPTVVLDDNLVRVSPFGPDRSAWVVIRERPSVAKLRALDVQRLGERELQYEALIRNDSLKNYQRELILRPPAPDGAPTFATPSLERA